MDPPAEASNTSGSQKEDPPEAPPEYVSFPSRTRRATTNKSAVGGEDDDYPGDIEDNDQETTCTGNDEGDGDAADPISTATSKLFRQYDPSRMALTPSERAWALEIKRTVERLPDLDAMTDFMYAQLGIVYEPTSTTNKSAMLDKAISHVYRLQAIRREYKLLDTFDHGIQCIPKLEERFYLSIDYDLHGGGYILVVDLARFPMHAWDSPDGIRRHFYEDFYTGNMLYPDLQAVRVGVTLLLECQGYKFQFGRAINLKTFKHGMGNIANNYPQKYKQIRFYNSPMMINIIANMAKAALPEEMHSKFQLGCKFEAGRLDRLFSIPTKEIAMEKLRARMIDLLRRRYHNEKYFTLEEEDTV